MVYYYEVIIINRVLDPLTYHSNKDIPPLTKVIVTVNNHQVYGYIYKKIEQPKFKTIEIVEVTNYYISNMQFKLIEFISKYYLSTLSQSINLLTPFDKTIQQKDIKPIKTNIILSTKQKEAYDFMINNKISLLFADTGSGKTEIYMKLFEYFLAQKKRSLFLLPEISLTPQMQNRLEEHFSDHVVLWHSKQTKKQKEKALQKIYENEAYIIAGPRSALFLPIDNLGCIVVDEEHDSSYKSNQNPRYNARDMAIYFAHILKIHLFLGSATPSLNSYFKFKYFRIDQSYHKNKKSYYFDIGIDEITQNIEEEIKQNFNKKEQTLLFLPTRANHKYLICQNCYYTYECPHCSIGMSVHQFGKKLVCHYCQYTQPIPNQCPACNSNQLFTHRIGTAYVYDYFRTNFKDINTQIFDRDHIKTNRELNKIIEDLNQQKIDLLIGTQMISKGHDYKHITLGCILGIDHLLTQSDYQTKENALALVIQIAGRVGRHKNSKVIIQTHNRIFFENYLDNWEQFLKDEIQFRENMYPPFKKLARILISHKNQQKAKDITKKLVVIIKAFKDTELIGFGTAPIEKIANKYREHILIRSDSISNLHKTLYACYNPKDTNIQIDVDPIEFN